MTSVACCLQALATLNRRQQRLRKSCRAGELHAVAAKHRLVFYRALLAVAYVLRDARLAPACYRQRAARYAAIGAALEARDAHPQQNWWAWVHHLLGIDAPIAEPDCTEVERMPPANPKLPGRHWLDDGERFCPMRSLLRDILRLADSLAPADVHAICMCIAGACALGHGLISQTLGRPVARAPVGLPPELPAPGCDCSDVLEFEFVCGRCGAIAGICQ
jgi:hypothetical protein